MGVASVDEKSASLLSLSSTPSISVAHPRAWVRLIEKASGIAASGVPAPITAVGGGSLKDPHATQSSRPKESDVMQAAPPPPAA